MQSNNPSLDSRAKGKISEFNVISKLVEKGLEVYTPVVDMGIDCIVRIPQKNSKPAKYFELQIKSARYENVSIRGAKGIMEDVEKGKPQNFFLVIPLRTNEKYEDIIYLTTEQMKDPKYKYKSEKGEIDINITAKDREWLIENQPLTKLIGDIISHE